jgi:hypothetical protein
MHSALAILGGALLTCVLGALVFGSWEDARTRELRKLMTALEGQRRIRDARARRARPPGDVLRSANDEQRTVDADLEQRDMHAAEVQTDGITRKARKAEEQQRRREEQEQAAALNAERHREKQADAARRKAEQAARKAEQQQRRQDEKEQAAALALERRRNEAERKAAAAASRTEKERRRPQQPPRASAEERFEAAQQNLTERPLYAWAQRIESENRAEPETD